MKIIALHLQKGGVGKTSLAGILALELQTYGRVLLIDCDAQANLSSWFLDNDNFEYELSDYFLNDIDIHFIIKKKFGIDIIPCFAIGGKLRHFAELVLPRSPLAFLDLKDSILRLGYDYAIFDLSPAMSILERSVLASIDEIITPIIPNFFSIDGLEIFKEELEKIEKGYRQSIVYNKIIINAVDRSLKLHNKVIKDASILNMKLFKVPIDQAFNRSQESKIDIRMCGLKKDTKIEISLIAQSLIEGKE